MKGVRSEGPDSTHRYRALTRVTGWRGRPTCWMRGRRTRTPGGSRPGPPPPGWDPQDAAEIARLREREVELAGTIVTYAYWTSLAPADLLAARDALKHHHEQQMADASSSPQTAP